MPEPLDYQSNRDTTTIAGPHCWYDTAGDAILFAFATLPWILIGYGVMVGFGLGGGGAVALSWILNIVAWLTLLPRFLARGRKTKVYWLAYWTDLLFWPYFFLMMIVGMYRWG